MVCRIKFVFQLLLLFVLLCNLSHCCITKVKIDSAGFSVGNHLQMYINNELITDIDYYRGISIAVLDQKSGEYLVGDTFDTYGSCGTSKLLVQFINNIEDGKIVLVGVKDEGSRCLNEETYQALYSIGWDPKFKLKNRESFAMIGEKGIKYPKAYGSSETSNVIMEKCIINECKEERIGNACKPLTWLQKCTQKIEDLSSDIIIQKQWKQHFGKYLGELIHSFKFEFAPSFVFDDDCFDIKIVLAGEHVKYNEVNLFENRNTIEFQRKESQLHRKDIEFIDDDSKFQWNIIVLIEFYMAGVRQHSFTIHMSKILYKELNHEEISHDQLNNSEIETQIQFCEDKSCNKLIPLSSQAVYQRHQDIFFQVTILDEKHKNLFLQPIGAKIGSLSCEILSSQIKGPGKTIYHIQGNLVQKNSTLSVQNNISQTINDRYIKTHVQNNNSSKTANSNLKMYQIATTTHSITIEDSKEEIPSNP